MRLYLPLLLLPASVGAQTASPEVIYDNITVTGDFCYSFDYWSPGMGMTRDQFYAPGVEWVCDVATGEWSSREVEEASWERILREDAEAAYNSPLAVMDRHLAALEASVEALERAQEARLHRNSTRDGAWHEANP